MKHFLLEGEHIVPFEQRAPELITAHRQLLQQGYDNGRTITLTRTVAIRWSSRRRRRYIRVQWWLLPTGPRGRIPR